MLSTKFNYLSVLTTLKTYLWGSFSLFIKCFLKPTVFWDMSRFLAFETILFGIEEYPLCFCFYILIIEVYQVSFDFN